VAAAAGAPGRAGEERLAGVLAGIGVAGALSFAASLWLTHTSPAWAFFGTPARGWEFALGGALAVLVARRAPPTGRAAAGVLLQAAGLTAIGVAAATYDRTLPYPGTAALLPAAGAVALLVGGRWAPDGPVSRALGAGGLRWLGRLSYAWYLWHWPLVSVAAVLDPGVGVTGRLAWSAAALGLAWLTYRLVERPAREGPMRAWSDARVSVAALVASAGMALVAQGAVRAGARAAARPDQRAFAAARLDRMRHDCWARTGHRLPPGPCVFGDARAPVTLALLGDSHAEHWLGGLDRAGQARGWRVLAMVKGGCPVADTPELVAGHQATYARACAEYREAMLRRIVASRPAAVILSSWDHYVGADGRAGPGRVSAGAWGRGLRRTYARLAAAGVPVVVVRGTPHAGFDVPACLSRRAARLPLAATARTIARVRSSPARWRRRRPRPAACRWRSST
jgi:hypothetical protein